MRYDLLLPRKIVFGAGRRREIGDVTKNLGVHAILVFGSRTLQKLGVTGQLADDLRSSGISVLGEAFISNEPETGDVDRVLEEFRSKLQPGTIIVALGGGAALDLGKAAAALLPQKSAAPVKEYLEGVGSGLKLIEAPLPVVAVPTTAGTGAEATKNAVISCYDPMFKKSLRDDRMMPDVALVDPELALHCPLKVTAESGMDAVTQLFESYVSKKRQPVTDALIEQGLPMAFEALTLLAEDLGNLEARTKMAHAALLSGICLANAGLGMAHGVAPSLGIHCRVTHGAACALMLPPALRTNKDVCLDRYGKLSRLLLGDPSLSDTAATEKMIEKVEELCDRLGTPRTLSELGVDPQKIPEIARDSKGNSMSGNPKELSTEDVEEILQRIR